MAKNKNTTDGIAEINEIKAADKILDHRVDFAVVVGVKMANPNGDPLNENMPRTDMDTDGNLYGIISPPCLKRHIRDTAQYHGEKIFIQRADRALETDGMKSLRARWKDFIDRKGLAEAERNVLSAELCKEFYDVRLFGGVMAFNSGKKQSKQDSATAGEDTVSHGIRGACTISYARSLAPVEIISVKGTKTCNGSVDSDKKASDTINMSYIIKEARYLFTGTINAWQAPGNHITENDVERFFVNTAMMWDEGSACRPIGSCYIESLLRIDHATKCGVMRASEIYNSIDFNTAHQMVIPESLKNIKGLKLTEISIDDIYSNMFANAYPNIAA